MTATLVMPPLFPLPAPWPRPSRMTTGAMRATTRVPMTIPARVAPRATAPGSPARERAAAAAAAAAAPAPAAAEE